VSSACAQDVLRERSRTVINPLIDDAALGVVGVAFLWGFGPGRYDDLHAAIGQAQRRCRSGNPCAQDEDIRLNQC